MQWWGSGFIPIIIYAAGIATVEGQDNLLTENSFDILNETSSELETE